jgi:hypothetical protein
METHCQTIDNEILDIREQLKRHTINFSTMEAAQYTLLVGRGCSDCGVVLTGC